MTIMISGIDTSNSANDRLTNRTKRTRERRFLHQQQHPILLMLLSAVIIFVSSLPSAHAYANWLKCYVDLDDTEVIMNKKILTEENAEHTVELQVQRLLSHERDNDHRNSDRAWETTNLSYPAETKSTFKVKVKPPPELEGRNMQFVVEVEATYNTGKTGSGASFSFPKMCDGQRSYGRNYNEAVTLEIDTTGNNAPDSIELVGAWAVGFGQVSLTPRLVMMLDDPEEGLEEEEEL